MEPKAFHIAKACLLVSHIENYPLLEVDTQPHLLQTNTEASYKVWLEIYKRPT